MSLHYGDPNLWDGWGPQGQKMCRECLAELEVSVRRHEDPKAWSEYLNDEYNDSD